MSSAAIVIICLSTILCVGLLRAPRESIPGIIRDVLKAIRRP